MVRYYNPHESALVSLFRWRFTLTSAVFRMGEFWLYMVCALTVMVLMDRQVVDLPTGVVNLDVWKLLSPQLSVTIFAVVFYNNQCYQRYMSLYSSCVDIDVNEKNLVSELLINFGHDPDLQVNIRQSCRYSLAAIFYFYLSMEDKSKGMKVTWDIIKDKGLLTKMEVDTIHDFPGTVFMLLLHWSSISVKDGVARLRAKKDQYSPPELAAMSSRMYVIIDRIGQSALTVRSIQNMPVPFSYFHLLNILISLTVLATGIGSLILVEQHDAPSYCLAFFPYSVVTFVLLALRQLSGELADPFGQDDLDFPIADFMRHIYDNVVAMLTMFERYSVMANLRKSDLDFVQVDFVKRPCAGEERENQQLTKILERSASRIPSKANGRVSMAKWILLADDEDLTAAYGPRNWVKPEDFKGAAKLIHWLQGDFAEQPNTIGNSVEDEPDREPEKAAVAKEPAKELPKQDACVASLERIEKQMAQLVGCMSELAASLKAGPPEAAVERKKERPEREKEKERSAPKGRSKKTEEKAAEE